VNRSLPALAVLLAASLTACGTTVAGAPAPTAPASASPSGGYAPDVPVPGAPPRFQPAVPEPKDARGIAACDLITEGQLVELGLRPETATAEITGNTRSCSWSSAVDDTNPAGLELNDETTIPVLDDLYLTREVFFRYEPREVAGHPAVRADYNDIGDCTIITAIADYQGVSTEGNPAGRPQPDPCALSTRMAEFVIANLPPLTEE
jgi:hypothetical protein